MRFIHVGDTHIGNVYKSETRNEDVKNVFKQLIDAAIDEKVDFIIHSGDLFNEGAPSLNALLFVTDQLNRLKANRIKMFIVPGSHDIGIGEDNSIIELFDRNDLLTNLNSKRYVSNEENAFVLRGETYKNAFICGIQGKRSNVEDAIFKKLQVSMDKDAWVKIFIFHHTISALGEQFKDLETESLPKGFDYYAAGHWHGHRDAIKYENGIVQYPGSTEYCDEKEIVDNPNRGYYLVEYAQDGIKKITYKTFVTREKDLLELDVNGKAAADIEKSVLSGIKNNDGRLLVIRLYGRMAGKRGDLNLSALKKAALELGYSYVSINHGKLSDSDDTVVEIKENDISKIESEFLTKKGYTENEVKLAKFLIETSESRVDAATIRKRAEEIFSAYDNKRD